MAPNNTNSIPKILSAILTSLLQPILAKYASVSRRVTIVFWPLSCKIDGGGKNMRYIIAWALGVPGILVVLWFLMAHH